MSYSFSAKSWFTGKDWNDYEGKFICKTVFFNENGILSVSHINWSGLKPKIRYNNAFFDSLTDQDKKTIQKKIKIIYYHAQDKSLEITGSSGQPDLMSKMMEECPGLKENATCPICERKTKLYLLIIHLNDEHSAKREYVADWLESLDIDLTFKGAKNV